MTGSRYNPADTPTDFAALPTTHSEDLTLDPLHNRISQTSTKNAHASSKTYGPANSRNQYPHISGSPYSNALPAIFDGSRYGQPHISSLPVPANSPGSANGIFFHDEDADGLYTTGEDLWADRDGDAKPTSADQHVAFYTPGPDLPVHDGAIERPALASPDATDAFATKAPAGSYGIQANVYYLDANNNGSYDSNEDIFIDQDADALYDPSYDQLCP